RASVEVICMVKERHAHYFLWFIFFGLIAGIAGYLGKSHQISSEAIWLFVAGILGILVTQNWLAEGRFVKPFDFIIGVIFTLIGVVGVLQAFNIDLVGSIHNVPAGLVTESSIIGLSLTPLVTALVHTVLGLQTLNHGLRGK
ncbi:MAG TPA: hypothetical protein VFU63_11950, partial [Ktedonobacterales bacterium]|nr:hypothetical protein [Ktedonobacterales bacterium]